MISLHNYDCENNLNSKDVRMQKICVTNIAKFFIDQKRCDYFDPLYTSVFGSLMPKIIAIVIAIA